MDIKNVTNNYDPGSVILYYLLPSFKKKSQIKRLKLALVFFSVSASCSLGRTELSLLLRFSQDCKSRCPSLHYYLEPQLGKNVLPSSFRLLAYFILFHQFLKFYFIFQQLQRFIPGYWVETSLRSQNLFHVSLLKWLFLQSYQ